MKSFLFVLTLGISVFALGCGDDTSTDGGGGSSSTTGSDTTTGGTTCKSSHTCINGSCECDTVGKAGQSCTDDTACVNECEVCS